MSEELSLSKKATTEALRNRIKKLESNGVSLQKELEKETDPAIRAIRQNKVNENQNDLASLRQEYDEALAEKKNSLTGTLQDLINNRLITDPLKRNHLAYLAGEDTYILIKNYSTDEKVVNVVEQRMNWNKMIGTFNHLLNAPGKFNEMSSNDIRTVFERAGASYLLQTASFNIPKWNTNNVLNIMGIQKTYWAPIDSEEEYSVFFDDLIHCLGGGKKENIAHLETWPAFKFLFPEKVGTTPNLNITGQPGGNGKGMFMLILQSIFTSTGVGLIKGKNIAGGFNALMKSKVVVVLDDEDGKTTPHSELKQMTGNGSLIIENKGIDAYPVDATASVLINDNGQAGSGVKLVGGGSSGEDRRWSIVKTEIPLLAYLQEKYSFSPEQAKELAEKMAVIFQDRIECGKWLAAMIRKHNVRGMPVLLPLHGQDYMNRLEDQKDNWSGIFESILPIINDQGFMRFADIKSIVELTTNEKVKNSRILSSKFAEFMSRKGHKNMETADINVKLLWPAHQGESDVSVKGSIRRVSKDKNTFDYSLISTEPFNKKHPLTLDTLQITSFDDVEESPDENSKAGSLCRCVAEIREDEHSCGLQEHAVSDTEMSRVAVSLTRTPKQTIHDLLRGINAH